MKKFYTLTVGENEYKLRLTASSIMAVEKKLNKPIFSALETIKQSAIETITTILWGAMQPLNHGFAFEKAAELFDDYIDEGNSVEDMMQVINSVFEVSGFFKKGQA